MAEHRVVMPNMLLYLLHSNWREFEIVVDFLTALKTTNFMSSVPNKLFEAACLLFEGDGESAKIWLEKPQVALGGLSPAQVSLEHALNLIARLEHSVVN